MVVLVNPVFGDPVGQGGESEPDGEENEQVGLGEMVPKDGHGGDPCIAAGPRSVERDITKVIRSLVTFLDGFLVMKPREKTTRDGLEDSTSCMEIRAVPRKSVDEWLAAILGEELPRM
jgi:hypothetical protein